MKARGASWGFPLRTDPTGRFALVTGTQELEEAMALILATRPGERRMRPDFGCRLPELGLGRALDAATARVAAREVRAALSRWEPRIEVLDVTVTEVARIAGQLEIDIEYRQVDTDEHREFRYRQESQAGSATESMEP